MALHNKPVRKAVIAAAGFGTRFLPQTKAMPKEMLPLVDKPIIQYVVEELVEAGVKDIIIVSNYSKRSIEDHFDVPSGELTAALQNAGKDAQLDELRKISDMANFVYVRQKQPLGNIAPLLYAKHLIDDEPFIYTYADDILQAKPNRSQQMIRLYEQTGGSIVPCIRLHKDEEYDRYGVVAGDKDADGRIAMKTIVEKPGKAHAPSDLASVSGYLFTPEILPYIEEAAKEYNGKDEVKIQEAMQRMIDDGHKYVAFEVEDSKYYDAGNKLEYLKTMIEFALKHEDIKKEFCDYLETLVKSNS
jgi:UTP--glucose-1-phosphate uridylyltransferase